ncbi:MAG: pyruvate carboxylase subunit B [Firmicutes bacterium]|jgi:oxaloacetate decarboxylase alpha subunit|nr:pyruvate carboxylase subunit B [Bacillota bacterium]
MKVGITETLLRDAHQSLWATRMNTGDMLKVAEPMDEAGYHAIEAWGGATFDASLRFLNEDPWSRLAKLRAYFKNTPLQMLLRGQNLLGYRHYPDDVVEYFVKKSVENGIKIMRIFDALNDVRNMEVAMQAAKEAGAHVQACVVYTTSPVHNVESFVQTALELKNKGADSICIKDMAGLLTPKVAYELVSKMNSEVGLPVELHSHYTSGMAGMAYLKGVEAGAAIIDTALSPLAFGTSQPATETMVVALEELGYKTGIDLKKLSGVAEEVRSWQNGYSDVAAPVSMDTDVLVYQVPGGMLSNLRNQLKQQGMLDKLPEVLAEIPRVREDLGYPPLVTPMSQIVGTQAVFNVLTGRYKVKSKEIRDYVKGYYGRPPAPISEELKAQILEPGEEPLTVRPAELLEPAVEKARSEIKQYLQRDEDVLTYLLFPEVAMEFFKKRQ